MKHTLISMLLILITSIRSNDFTSNVVFIDEILQIHETGEMSKGEMLKVLLNDGKFTEDELQAHLKLLASTDKQDRYSKFMKKAAIEAAGFVGDQELSSVLEGLLENAKPYERGNILQSIAMIRCRENTIYLEEVFSQRSKYSANDRLRSYHGLAALLYSSKRTTISRGAQNVDHLKLFLARAAISDDDDIIAVKVLDGLAVEFINSYSISQNRVEVLDKFQDSKNSYVQKSREKKLLEIDTSNKSRNPLIQLDITPLPIFE